MPTLRLWILTRRGVSYSMSEFQAACTRCDISDADAADNRWRIGLDRGRPPHGLTSGEDTLTSRHRLLRRSLECEQKHCEVEGSLFLMSWSLLCF